MAKVYVFFTDGMEEIEALTPVDLLRRAGADVVTVSITGSTLVNGSHKIPVGADCLIEDVASFDDADLLILPGGKGFDSLGECAALQDALLAQNEKKKLIAAICAAPSILAKFGLLSGKNACSFPSVEPQLSAAGALVTRNPVEVCGNIITSRGMGTALPFALTLTKTLFTKQAADSLAASIVYSC